MLKIAGLVAVGIILVSTAIGLVTPLFEKGGYFGPPVEAKKVSTPMPGVEKDAKIESPYSDDNPKAREDKAKTDTAPGTAVVQPTPKAQTEFSVEPAPPASGPADSVKEQLEQTAEQKAGLPQ